MWSSTYFQNILGNSYQLDTLHSKILTIQLIIALVIGSIILLVLNQSLSIKFNDEWMLLETIWTVLPGLILVWLGAPSLTLLYESESLASQSSLIVKITGHQWYWSYNLPELNVDFDSITIKDSNIFPLMGVTEKMVLPFNSSILIMVTSDDVIHSFAIPALGIKADANPGRLNSVSFTCFSPAQMIGQCSELCGSLHSNMTLSLEFTSFLLFLDWVESQNETSFWSTVFDTLTWPFPVVKACSENDPYITGEAGDDSPELKNTFFKSLMEIGVGPKTSLSLSNLPESNKNILMDVMRIGNPSYVWEHELFAKYNCLDQFQFDNKVSMAHMVYMIVNDSTLPGDMYSDMRWKAKHHPDIPSGPGFAAFK